MISVGNGYTNYNGFWDSKAAAPPIQPPQNQPAPRPDPPQGQRPNSNGNKDRLIVTQVVYKAIMDKGEVSKQALASDVAMIMEVGTTDEIPF